MANGDKHDPVSDMLRTLRSVDLEIDQTREMLRDIKERLSAIEAKTVIAKFEITQIKKLMADIEDRVARIERRRKLGDTPA
jgi:hypothetical protein